MTQCCLLYHHHDHHSHNSLLLIINIIIVIIIFIIIIFHYASIKPQGICHTCVTYRGDDANWESLVKETGWGGIGKYLIFFTDDAGLTWDKKPIVKTMSETIEMFIGK